MLPCPISRSSGAQEWQWESTIWIRVAITPCFSSYRFSVFLQSQQPSVLLLDGFFVTLEAFLGPKSQREMKSGLPFPSGLLRSVTKWHPYSGGAHTAFVECFRLKSSKAFVSFDRLHCPSSKESCGPASNCQNEPSAKSSSVYVEVELDGFRCLERRSRRGTHYGAICFENPLADIARSHRQSNAGPLKRCLAA